MYISIVFILKSSACVIARLEKQLQRALQTARKYQEEADKFKKLFSSVQCQRILTGKAIAWEDDDISQAITLRSHGPRAYDILRESGYPLPSPSTLRRWSAKIDLQPGYIYPVLGQLSQTLNTDWQRLCVVSIDEMKTKREFTYLKDLQRVVLPTDYCQVMMVRGLCSNWQQVVYYDYGVKSSKDLILKSIEKLEASNLIPVAIVSDLGPDNQRMWSDLKVSYEQPFCVSNSDRRLFVFADFPHMLKLSRNHMIDHGFKRNGKTILKKPIKRLIDSHSKGLNIAHKLTKQHLSLDRTKRMNVRLAAQLLSRSTGAALLAMRDILTQHTTASPMPEETEETAHFCFKMNDLFDLFNVSRPVMDSRYTRKAFGLDLGDQQRLLDESYKFVSSLRHPSKKAMIPFQKGILQDINGLRMLYEHVHEKYGVTYIITERLNQDCLERLFGLLRAKGGGLNDHPTPVELHRRLKMCILGRSKDSERLRSFCSNIQDEQEPYRWPSVVPKGELGRTIKHSMDKDLPVALPEVKAQVVEYVAGYLCTTKGQPQPHIFSTTSNEEYKTYTEYANQGGLNRPPQEIVEETTKLNNIFENADFYGPRLMDRLITSSQSISLSHKKKEKFFNTCIFNKIRQLNDVLKAERQTKGCQETGDRRTSRKYKKIITYMNSIYLSLIRI